jgi:peptidoglycan/xylan/chitin deacetylase (PgdA/CDA1 family)
MRPRDPILRVLRTQPVLNLVNSLSSSHPRVLMWHRFGPDTTDRVVGVQLFEEQMATIRRDFEVVSASEMCAAWRERRLRRRMVTVTVDDGYEDFYTYAFPILKKYRIPATFYVTSGFIDRRLWLWPDQLRYAIFHSGLDRYDCELSGQPCTFDLRGGAAREQAWNTLADHALTLPWDEATRFIGATIADLHRDTPPVPTAPFAALNWDQLREIAAAGIEIGAHTSTHPLLTQCTPMQMEREAAESKHELENQLQRPVHSLAYPHGVCNDMVRLATIRAGFSNAVSGTADKYVIRDAFDIKRFGSGHDMVSFRNAVYGVHFAAAQCGIHI